MTADVQDLILTRLQICFEEVTGIKRWSKLPGVLPLLDFPGGYTLVGGMTGRAPATDAGSAAIPRLYVGRLFIAPAEAGTDFEELGFAPYVDLLPYIALVENYFLTHPRLHTDGVNVAALQEIGLMQDVQFQDSGPVVRRAPGGVNMWAVDFNLYISARVAVQRVS
jgi:hypothetical protein